MAKCSKCGNKVSAFATDALGRCPECVRMESSAYREKLAESKAVEEERIAAEKAHQAELEQQIKSGALPSLPCLTPKSLELKGNSVVFIGKKSSEAVPLQNISSFTLKKPSFGTNGSITIKLQKSSDLFASIGGLAVGIGGELVAVFKPEFYEIAKQYEEYITRYNSAAPLQSEVPTVNDLRALKALVDEGVITEEEFSAKKKQLLGI